MKTNKNVLKICLEILKNMIPQNKKNKNKNKNKKKVFRLMKKLAEKEASEVDKQLLQHQL